MAERNPCKDSGCPASCCRNIAGHVFGSTEFFLKAYPNAIRLNSEDEVRDRIRRQEFGVYYFEDRGRVDFSVSGDCPNLMDDNSCNIHGQRFYPRACLNMVFGSMACGESKIKHQINEVTSMALSDA
jgi:Fe-S-cluster containining protein